MIILDTNVISEPLKLKPNLHVLQWLDRQVPEELYVTTVALAELLSGIEVLPEGRRKARLSGDLAAALVSLFGERILPFDIIAAQFFADVNARTADAGNTMGFADCAIAAIAIANDATVATRNVRDFRGTRIEIVNPWA